MKTTFLLTCAVCLGLCIVDAEAQVSRLDSRFNIKRSQPVNTTVRTTPQGRPARTVNTAPPKPRVQESPFVVITGLYNDESVRLPKWYLKEMGELLGKLKDMMSPSDYLELLRKEERQFGNIIQKNEYAEEECAKRKKLFRSILNTPDDTSLYDWSHFLKLNSSGIMFYPNLSYINCPILASDENYVITPSPLTTKANVTSFWNSRTGRIYRDIFISVDNPYVDFSPVVKGIRSKRQSSSYLFNGGFSEGSGMYDASLAVPSEFSVYTVDNPPYGQFPFKIRKRFDLPEGDYSGESNLPVGLHYYTNRDAGLAELPILRNQSLLETLRRQISAGISKDQINQVEIKNEATIAVQDLWQYNLAVSLNSLYSHNAPVSKTSSGSTTMDPKMGKAILQKLNALGCPPGEYYGEVAASFSDTESVKLDDEYELFLCRGTANEEGGFTWMMTLGLINHQTGDVMFFSTEAEPPRGPYDNERVALKILSNAKMKALRNLDKRFAFMSKFERFHSGTMMRRGEKLRITLTLISSDNKGQEFYIIDLSPEDYTYEVIARRTSVSSTLPYAYIPEKEWILCPEGDNKYSIEELNSWGTNRKVADMYIDPAQGYAIALPDGRYVGSPGCEKFLQYGDGERVVGMQALAPWRNRPAEVLEALGGNADDIAALRETTKRWLRKQGFDPDNMPSEPFLKDFPAVEVNMPNLFSTTDTARFTVTAKATANDIAKVIVRVDGVEVPQSWENGLNIAAGEQEELTVEVPLASGQNWIEITPVDGQGISGDTFRFRTIYRSKAKSDLYIVALGVSDYDNPDLQLQYAAKDAKDIAAAFGKYGTGRKHLLVLTDKEVKDKTVLEKVKMFLSTASLEDRIVLYVAGHGMLDDQLNYYYAPAGFNIDRIGETGIAMDELTACLKNAKARKKLLLLDTCHSGMLGEAGEEKLAMSGVQLPHGVRAIQHRGMKVKKAIGALNTKQKKRYIEDLFSRGDVQRGVNIVAGAAGAEYALESGAWKNGVFTASVIQALSGAGTTKDMDGDGFFSVEEVMRSVMEAVNKQTGGQQKPNIVAAEAPESMLLVEGVGCTSIKSKIEKSDWEGVRELLERGMKAYNDVEASDIMKSAIEHKAPVEMLRRLIAHGWSENVSYADAFETALRDDNAYVGQLEEVAQIFLEKGVKRLPGLESFAGKMLKESPKLVEMLLIHGTDANREMDAPKELCSHLRRVLNGEAFSYQVSPLYLVTFQYCKASNRFQREQELEKMRILLENGANPNIRDASPLYFLCRLGGIPFSEALPAIKLLIRYGANIHITDRFGKEPMDSWNPNYKILEQIAAEARER